MDALKTPEFSFDVDDEQISAHLEFHGDTTVRTIELHEAGSNDSPANLGSWRLTDNARTFEIDMDNDDAYALVDAIIRAGIARFSGSRPTKDGCGALARFSVPNDVLLIA